MSSVIILGSCNMDLIARVPHLPAPGETILGTTLTTTTGGKGANQAVAATRLGAPVKLIGRIGADEFGKALRGALSAVGVDTQYVTADPEAATGVALINVDDAGQNSIVVTAGANARVSRSDVDSAAVALRGARVLVTQLEIPLETAAYALERARAWGVRTILNPAPAQPLTRDIFASCDILVPNATEAAQLTNLPVNDLAGAQAAALALQKMGARNVVLTLGDLGAVWLDEHGTSSHVAAFSVKAVDSTAAGDAFVGALAAAFAHDKDWLTALTEASAAGALATTKPGAQPSLPTRADLDDLLALTP